MTSSLPRKRSTPELRGLTDPETAGTCFSATFEPGLRTRHALIDKISWSGRRDSNPRPIAWKAMTLPAELLPHPQKPLLS